MLFRQVVVASCAALAVRLFPVTATPAEPVAENDDPVAAALRLDSECEGHDVAGHGSCGASLLQLRGEAAKQQLRSDVVAGEVGAANSEANSTASLRARQLCPRDTGGSCLISNCDASRGEAECIKRRCMCKVGFCNEHGVCKPEHEEENQEVILGDGSCNRDTSGTCGWSTCYPFRNAVCDEKKCLCRPGFCAVSGICHPDRGTFKGVREVPVTKESPHFPGAQDRVQTALVCSGGGGRAMVVTLGVLRAMEALGLMPEVDAVSSVSGGTWAAALYMFAHKPPLELLGPRTVPSTLTRDELAKTPAAAGAAATTSTTKIAARLWWEGVPSHHLWVYTMGEALLEPFGLNDKDAYMAPSKETLAQIKSNNPQLEGASFVVPVEGRPKTFVMSGAILAPTGYLAAASNVVSLQMMPDFTGSPFYPNRSAVAYDSQGRRHNVALADVVVGGGLVESFAFGSYAPESMGQVVDPAAIGSKGMLVAVTAPPEPLSLAKAVGVSSAGPASALTQVGPHGALNVENLNPRSLIWSLLAKRFGLPGQRAATYSLGDGGNIDNSGLLAMLQRKAHRIIWLVSTGFALPETKLVCELGGQVDLDPKVVNNIDSQLRDKFGYWLTDDLGEFLSQNTVFARQDLHRVLCSLARLRDAGKPTVTMETLRVNSNQWWGIAGGFDADILFVYNEKCNDFVQQLPADTRRQLDLGLLGDFHRFPHYLPVMQNIGEATALTASQVNLLAAHAEFMVVQSVELFRFLLKS